MTDVERKIGEVYRILRLTIQQEKIPVPDEVEGMIKRVFGECNNHLIKEVMRYSEQEFEANYDFIINIVALNPGTTFEYWAERHSNYRDSLYIIGTLKLHYDNRENEAFIEQFFERYGDLDHLKKDIQYLINSEKPERSDLSITDLALIAVYERRNVTRQNADEYLKGTGHKSGEKFYQEFCKYSKTKRRIGIETSRKTTENKIERIEKIIPHLSERAQKVANDEVMVLKSRLEEETF